MYVSRRPKSAVRLSQHASPIRAKDTVLLSKQLGHLGELEINEKPITGYSVSENGTDFDADYVPLSLFNQPSVPGPPRCPTVADRPHLFSGDDESCLTEDNVTYKGTLHSWTIEHRLKSSRIKLGSVILGQKISE